MEIEVKSIKKSELEKLLTRLVTDGKKVLGPVKKGNLVEFEQLGSLEQLTEDYIVTTQSAKSAAFPRVEKILEYKTSKNLVEMKDVMEEEVDQTIIFGSRPCDADGFRSLDAIFNWDIRDNIYNERYQNTLLISVSCSQSDAYCFCTSVGGSPGNTSGSDILLTKVASGDYMAEIITDKGKDFCNTYSKHFGNSLNEKKEDYLAKVEPKFDTSKLTGNLASFFENEVWLDESLRCIGCGACAFVCPTCACFDIQDEFNTKTGNRVRCWDSCGFSLFTLHTSGHNPREVQSQRWRQRIMHKFSYMPERQHVVGCVGCGRCSRACPVDMNISEHLVKLSEVMK